eukprot:gene19403-15497_t
MAVRSATVGACLLFASTATQAAADLFISEVIEGTSYNQLCLNSPNHLAGAHPLFALIMHSMLETTELHEHGYNNANKAYEIYNPTEGPISLSEYAIGHSVDGKCAKKLWDNSDTDTCGGDYKYPLDYVSLTFDHAHWETTRQTPPDVLQAGQTLALCSPRSVLGGPPGGGGGTNAGKDKEATGWVLGGGGGGGGGTGMGHPDAKIDPASCDGHHHNSTRFDATVDQTLVRKPTVSEGNGGDWDASRGTDATDCEWIVLEKDSVHKFGEHTADLPETPWVAPADDVDSETNGPNAKGCGEGRAVDTTKYDSKFICDCAGTAGTGDNCENLGISDAGSPAAAVVPACMAVAASLAAAFVAV